MNNREVQDAFIRAMHRFRKTNLNVDSELLTKGEFFCMGVIREYMERHPESRGMYVWELAHHMRVQPPAASRMLRGLERKGFIERSVDREDRRNTYIALTEQGDAVWCCTGKLVQEFTDRVIERMGIEDMITLINLWNRLSDIIEDEHAKESMQC